MLVPSMVNGANIIQTSCTSIFRHSHLLARGIIFLPKTQQSRLVGKHQWIGSARLSEGHGITMDQIHTVIPHCQPREESAKWAFLNFMEKVTGPHRDANRVCQKTMYISNRSVITAISKPGDKDGMSQHFSPWQPD